MDDLISRQAAIEALDEQIAGVDMNVISVMRMRQAAKMVMNTCQDFVQTAEQKWIRINIMWIAIKNRDDGKR